MATRTVDEGFRDFYKKISTLEPESETTKLKIATIEKCLREAYGLTELKRIGAFETNTFVVGYSDLDYLAIFPSVNLDIDSNKSLNKIKNTLNSRFNTYIVRVNTPGVNLPIGKGDSELLKIIPAYIFDNKGEHIIYAIPNFRDGWMKVSPDAYKAYFAEKDKALGGRLLPIIRFIKAWKFYSLAPIQSVYLELKLIEATNGWTEFNYFEGLVNCFRYLQDSKLAPLEDPMGIAGVILPNKPDKSLEDSKFKLSNGLLRATEAYEAYLKRDVKTAFESLRKLYNQAFPSMNK